MADLDKNTAVLIAVITACSVVVGGLITSGVNYLIEEQKSKMEEVKLQHDKEAQELELRNQAYIEFLSLTEDGLYEPSPNGDVLVDPRAVAERVARLVTYGSPAVRGIIFTGYPFESWDQLEKTQKLIMAELFYESGGEPAFNKSPVWQSD
jgi:hypothetical protein